MDVIKLTFYFQIIRKLQLSEFSRMLQSCFDTFKDAKDEGALALTPLYLMLGCVTPFWIYPSSFEGSIPLPVLSGILSIAVGDTAASICGTRFGKRHWPGTDVSLLKYLTTYIHTTASYFLFAGTEKTIEGTMGCILSQILVLFSFGAMGT